ncbi:MAG: hypothetical protein R2932_59710 [Caldilineaceae bacterium]
MRWNKPSVSLSGLIGKNIVAFLVGLDQIEAIFAGYGQDTSAVRAEEGRWESLQKRIKAKPKISRQRCKQRWRVSQVSLATCTGAWLLVAFGCGRRTKPRSDHAKWVGLAIAAIAVVGLLWWGIYELFPHDGNTNRLHYRDRATGDGTTVTGSTGRRDKTHARRHQMTQSY